MSTNSSAASLSSGPVRAATRPERSSGPAAAPTRVLIADRQPLYRDAVARALRQHPQLQSVGEAADGRTALELIRRLEPEIAIVDVRLEQIDGRRVLNAVVRDELPTRIVLLAAATATDGGYEAIAAGAAGWLSRAIEATELCEAIESVARGETALGREAQTEIAHEIRERAQGGQPVLSEREQAVLVLVADGRSAEEIGRALHLSTGTVKSVLLRIYKRFGVSERAAAVAVALRRGLID